MDNPKCPYCGAEMLYFERRTKGYGFMGYYLCRACKSRAPRIDNNGIDAADIKAAARAAAMRRWVEPNRVLTLEELGKADHERNLYFETRDFGPDDGDVFESSVECAQETFCDEDEGADARKEYGVRVRCWLRRPTDEERAGAWWVEEAGE